MRNRNPINANNPAAIIAAFIWTIARETLTDKFK